MQESIKISEIAFEIVESTETNDFEVKIIIDGISLLRDKSDLMGMDPNDIIYNEPNLYPKEAEFRIQIARCGCGIPECSGAKVKIARKDGMVIWSDFEGDKKQIRFEKYTFDEHQYIEAFNKTKQNYSWESPDRTAERILRNKIDNEYLKTLGFQYDWASGRSKDGYMTLSLMFVAEPYQILINQKWTDEAPEKIAEKMLATISKPISTWEEVEWISQTGKKSKPPIFAGKGWKEFKGF